MEKKFIAVLNANIVEIQMMEFILIAKRLKGLKHTMT